MSLKIKITSAVVVALTVIVFSSCKDGEDDFSGPTAQALDVTFGTAAGFGNETLRDISIDNNGNIYATSKTKIFKVDASGNVTLLAGSGNSVVDGTGANASFQDIDLLSFDEANNIYAIDSENIRKIRPDGTVSSFNFITAEGSPLIFAKQQNAVHPSNRGLAIKGNSMFLANYYSITKGYGTKSHNFSGTQNNEVGFVDGASSVAKFSGLGPVILSPDGKFLVVGDVGSVRRISLADSSVTTLSGSDQFGVKDGSLAEASFQLISDITMDNSGNYYVSSFNTIRKISSAGVVTTLAGPIKTNGSVFSPGGLAIDKDFRYLYVADMSKPGLIIKIDVTKF